ncbi:MAG: hypothetical protein ABJZ55_03775 [Fuerstiella sp.]
MSWRLKAAEVDKASVGAKTWLLRRLFGSLARIVAFLAFREAIETPEITDFLVMRF